jgi:hypothetical protein
MKCDMCPEEHPVTFLCGEREPMRVCLTCYQWLKKQSRLVPERKPLEAVQPIRRGMLGVAPSSSPQTLPAHREIHDGIPRTEGSLDGHESSGLFPGHESHDEDDWACLT